jgi:hypothetical protein
MSMPQSFRIAGVIACALLVTLLFHNQSLGVNLLIFEIIIIPLVIFTSEIKFNSLIAIISVLSVTLTSIFSVFTNTGFTIFMNFLSVLVFLGVVIYPEAKLLVSTIVLSVQSIVKSPITFTRELMGLGQENTRFASRYIRLSVTLLFPLLVLTVFILMYKSANPIFNTLVDNIISSISSILDIIISKIDFSLARTFVLGLLISTGILLRIKERFVIEYDSRIKLHLVRRETPTQRYFATISLRKEYTAALFLFASLTVVIIILNILDIYWVWFNFEWQGQSLKHFVHEGTYILILSIILSLSLVLYYFRRNLNFYPNNTLLKRIVYLWLAQNALLSLSVGVRNYWYIHYLSLAYKRIGVFVFLILAVFCIYTIWVKVKEQKSIFYLIRMNGLSVFIVLVITSLVNWDSVIAQYNFNNPNKSFLHLEFMATLSDCTLPDIDKSLSVLDSIEKQQAQKFQSLRYQPMSAKEYQETIQQRKVIFKNRWENQHFLSWNYPDYKAYQQLFGNTK